MLPSGWKRVKLSDFIKSLDAGVSVNSVDEPASNNKIGILKTSCVSSGTFNPNENKTVVEADLNRVSTPVKADRIILSRMNSPSLVGANAYVEKDYSNLYLPDRLWQLEPYSNKMSMRWLSYVLCRQETKSIFLNMATGTSNSMKNITKEDVLNLKVIFPPFEEQKKIAETLSVWDKAIEKTEKLIEAKETVLSEYGRNLFGKTNRNVRNDWDVVALSSVLNEHGDKSTGKEEVYSVSVHKGLVNQIEHLGRSFAAKNTTNYNRVHYGDIVYTKSPTGDFPLGIVKQSLVEDDVIVSPLYGVFTPKTFELGVILDFYFSSAINANNYLHPIAQKGAKNTINITNKKFLSAKLCLPLNLKEQKKVAEFIQVTKKEMSVLQEILENYKKQKEGLMQKLLTGQWRVK